MAAFSCGWIANWPPSERRVFRLQGRCRTAEYACLCASDRHGDGRGEFAGRGVPGDSAGDCRRSAAGCRRAVIG